ncbi:MAG: hypothetical protein IPK77_09580 [Cellvibrio sp.]|nr:hypothetical protein [Cellvibrio sp.]
MPYRALSNNERILIKRQWQSDPINPISEEACEQLMRFLEKFAEWRNMPAYEFFLAEEKKKKENPVEPIPKLDRNDPHYLKKLGEFLSQNSSSESDSTVDRLFGDASDLTPESMRLRTLFFNSRNYRKTRLKLYLTEGFLTDKDLDNFELIESVLRDFRKKYPGTRMGIISLYEVYFGDPSQFAYHNVKNRKAFFADPKERQRILAFYQLPIDWDLKQIKAYFRKTGLESGSLAQSDLDAWEGKIWEY